MIDLIYKQFNNCEQNFVRKLFSYNIKLILTNILYPMNTIFIMYHLIEKFYKYSDWLRYIKYLLVIYHYNFLFYYNL